MNDMVFQYIFKYTSSVAVEGILINFTELFFAIQEIEPIFAELTFAIERF